MRREMIVNVTTGYSTVSRIYICRRGKFIQLDDISCRIKTGCKDHPPWPRGICSKCQPNSITLNRQTYRHVDNVMFENASLVERFLNYWRSTGHQRIGYLYGRYEVHSDVPLGIRAVVAAIYEPPQVHNARTIDKSINIHFWWTSTEITFAVFLFGQESTKDTIRLLPDEKEALVEELGRTLNLRRIGWIFTDLIADDIKKGTVIWYIFIPRIILFLIPNSYVRRLTSSVLFDQVKHVRNIESHFLSAQECIMAGYFQNRYPNPCRFSPNGYFGSKFVTVCVTGKSIFVTYISFFKDIRLIKKFVLYVVLRARAI